MNLGTSGYAVSMSSLQTYLNDHRAGAEAGVELANKLRKQHEGTPHGPFFAELAAAIEADRDTLDSLMAGLGVEQDRIKQIAGWAAEKVSRVKLNEHLTGSQELTRLLEAEALGVGITGKRALWVALKTVAGAYPSLAAVDFDSLIGRAEAQFNGLEQRRLEIAPAALRPHEHE